MSDVILEVKDLGVDFGGLTAVDNFNLTINKKEIVGLIGPNGAGKTTVFNLLTKVYKPSRGEIYLNGDNITNKNTIEVNRLGIARTFQNIRLFNKLSVIDNVKVGMHGNINYSLFDSLFRSKKYNNEEKEIDKQAHKILELLDLDDSFDVLSSSLPYGKQRRLEIARALASSPKLLLLDEPAAGMNPNETIELMNVIKRIRDEFDLTILLIEHDMKFVMGICDRITVLNYGMILTSGNSQEIINNPQVIKAYLGE